MTNVHLPRAGLRALPALLLACFACALPAAAFGATSEDKAEFSVKAGSLSFSTAPAMPPLSEVTLTGGAQTTNTTMTNFGVKDATGSGSGWNATVAGQSGTEKSAVFAQYCPTATCGSDSKGYVPSGATLPANSLTLNSTGASFTGGLGTAPTLECASGCVLDGSTPVKVVSNTTGLLAGEGVWSTTGFSANSLALAAPTTIRALQNEEIYRANVLWTLSTGP